jgi:protein TonB
MSPMCYRARYSPDPDPEKERKARHQGAVALDLVVSSDGLPRDVKVLHTLSPEFDKAAVDAVMNWRFTPATKDGNPVAAEIDVQVTFRLR